MNLETKIPKRSFEVKQKVAVHFPNGVSPDWEHTGDEKEHQINETGSTPNNTYKTQVK